VEEPLASASVEAPFNKHRPVALARLVSQISQQQLRLEVGLLPLSFYDEN